MHSRWPWRTAGRMLVVIALSLTGCSHQPPDLRTRADQLTSQIRALAGVSGAKSDLTDRFAEGNVHFWLSVDVTPDAGTDQIATIAGRYLDAVRAGDYPGYETELNIRHGTNVFTVENREHVAANTDQIIGQARDWVALHNQFPGATVTLSATLSYPPSGTGLRDRGHPAFGTIDIPEADYAALTTAVSTLGAKFPQLAVAVWALSAGKIRPAEITTSQRLPNPQELSVWNALNADQTIPHGEAMTINAPAAPPVWISEQALSHDPAIAVALAVRHLPIVATLPAPLLYTATDQLQGHRDYNNRTTAPVAVTIGGCTPRTYRPDPTERKLIGTYETCRS
ncbi:MAG: hypothetical protein NVSMB60_08930 [Mycobacterium sp.]